MNHDQHSVLINELNVTAEALRLAAVSIANTPALNKKMLSASQVEAELMRMATQRYAHATAPAPQQPGPAVLPGEEDQPPLPSTYGATGWLA